MRSRKSKPITIRIDDSLYQELERIAVNQAMSVHSVVKAAVIYGGECMIKAIDAKQNELP